VRKTALVEAYRPVAEELDAVRERIVERVAQGFLLVGDRNRYEAYTLSGKLVRPALFLLSSRLVDIPSTEATIEMAAACEMMHLASLIHDDVLDEAEMRRGEPSVNAVWDNRVAILVGDWLVAEALRILSTYGGQDAVEATLDVMKEVVAGEMAQARHGQKNVSLTEEQYFDIIRRKTASLLQVVCQLPVIADGRNGWRAEALGTYGHNFGMAYQIVDDTLDLMGAAEVIGKPVGGDIKSGRLTLPLIHLEETLPEGSSDAKRLHDILEADPPDDADMEWLRALLQEHGACTRAAQTASRHVDVAKEALNRFPDNEAHRSLTGLADFVVARDF
jgi:octaprenyl-diphosphate synthase